MAPDVLKLFILHTAQFKIMKKSSKLHTVSFQSYCSDPEHGRCHLPRAADSTIIASAAYSSFTGSSISLVIIRYTPGTINKAPGQWLPVQASAVGSVPSTFFSLGPNPGSPSAELGDPNCGDTSHGWLHHHCSQSSHFQQFCVNGHLTWSWQLYVYVCLS